MTVSVEDEIADAADFNEEFTQVANGRSVYANLQLVVACRAGDFPAAAMN